jgi:formylglycine-generating enzyme required for sulfatase activity
MSSAASRLCARCHLQPAAAARAAAVAGVALSLAMQPPGTVTARAVAPGAADVVTLESLLERAGEYFLNFEGRFSDVVTEERYVQEATGPASGLDMAILARRGGGPVAQMTPPASQRRELVSDFLLVKLPDTDEWLPFRDVFEVDSRRVRDREDRLSKLFLQPAPTALDQARRIMDESARYNIGNIQRTINLPVFALEVLRPSTQSRFRFSRGRLDASVGPNVYEVGFRELTPPTLIHGLFGKDLFSHGRFWIEATSGRVLKSELVVDDVTVHASVTVRYQIDQEHNLAVPVDMKEEYKLPNGARVSGVATYGRFRRFEVRVADEIAKPPGTITDAVTGMTLVELPAGRFSMGSPSSEAGRGDDESQHEVTIGRPFLLGRFEVTQEQWRTIMRTSPSKFAACGSTCPVERVSYQDVQRFLDVLNARASGVHYRLPTEAEWEYACRAGSATPFATGGNVTTSQANYDGLRPYTSFLPGVFREQPTPVGSFDVNVWGIGDMHGNVREWTSDWYAPYPPGTARDPRGPVSGTSRVVRGGSWLSSAASLRCAVRESRSPTDPDGTIGFRVAADLPRPR